MQRHTHLSLSGLTSWGGQMHISICCIYILGYNNGQMEPTCEMKFQLQVSREDMLAIELFVTGTDGINASSSYIIIHLIYICICTLKWWKKIACITRFAMKCILVKSPLGGANNVMFFTTLILGLLYILFNALYNLLKSMMVEPLVQNQ